MEFIINVSFSDSLARLAGDEQRAVKTTAFDLQLNPASPGMNFHKLDRAKDRNFWSVRASSDIRIIVHRTGSSLILCYADHHDKAYAWAERRKIEFHPITGTPQIVVLKEEVVKIIRRVFVEVPVAAPPKPTLGQLLTDDEMLAYGVPPELLDVVRRENEDGFMRIYGHLPGEAAEALMQVLTGNKPRVPQPVAPGTDPYAHPDAQRRFRNIYNIAELQRAFDYPWDKWLVFLHPEQRQLVEREYSGPARVSGSAGTGKTIVAVHRAVHLARKNPQARILLTTISEVLANDLRHKRIPIAGRADTSTCSAICGSLLISWSRLWRRSLASTSEIVVSRIRACGFLRAKCTARCTATIVFPVPAEPDTRAGPEYSRSTHWRCSGCKNTSHLSHG